MWNNGGIAIDLGDDGNTLNDAIDLDVGDNDLQNYPEISETSINLGASPPQLDITFRVSSQSIHSDYPLNIDFYWTPFDEDFQGRFFLGTHFNYGSGTSGSGDPVTVTFNLPEGTTGGLVGATALEVNGRDTSELSPGMQFGFIDLIFEDGFEG